MTAGRPAITPGYQYIRVSKVVFKGSLAAELKLSATSARSSLAGQAYAPTQSGCTHTHKYTQPWNQNRSKRLPRESFALPGSHVLSKDYFHNVL